ncbi:MAG TPA: polysaccharide deacetylase family protein [Terracidiphilus sp.]|nr:polysaccharide deacetylase family protein [Terracidiphilus sp.]
MPTEGTSSSARLSCSIVIPTWRRADLLRETLRSVLDQDYSSFDVHVVSDGDDPALRTLATEFSAEERIEWHFHLENQGQAAARNTGARSADGDVLLFLDDDAVPGPNWIARHMEHHAHQGRLRPIAVAGRIVEEAKETPGRVTDRALQRGWQHTLEDYAQLFDRSGPDSIGDAFENAISFGLNCSIRRELFLRHGGFLEQLRMTDEDVELGLRLYLAGVETVFEPRAFVHHRGAKDVTAYFRTCWAASGATDVYRVFQLGHHNTQTRRLLSITHGSLPTRLLRRLVWHGGSTLRALVDVLEGTANRSGSRLLASAWGRLCPQTLYWNGVRSTGCTLSQLKGVSAPRRCALMFHTLCKPQTPVESTYYLAPDRFRLLMRRFVDSGYSTATSEQWMRDDLPRKHALLTFDDGYEDLFTELLPWLRQHGFTALVFLVADAIGGTNFWDERRGLRTRQLLTLAQIREMHRSGVEFSSHSLTHPWLPGLADEALEREVSGSKHKLEDLLGMEVSAFAYPYGGVDRRVRAAVARAGYKLAFTTLPGVNRWNDPLCQKRADIHNQTTPSEFRLHLYYGMGYRQCGAALLRDLEHRAPTATLRRLIGGFRQWGSRTLEKRIGRGSPAEVTESSPGGESDSYPVGNNE